ncbi:MAG: EamA family transporter [Clostridia bacterium]|nr:EamA family transporter [Clostridia bacterium]
MNSILLIIIIIAGAVQGVCKKEYDTRVSGGAYSFNAAATLFALLIFVVTGDGNFEYSLQAFAYSVGFALSYAVATAASFLAICTGPLSIGSLVIQYSLVVPTLYGLIMLDEPIEPLLFVGIGLLLISLVLINFEGKEERKITFKWGVYVLLAFIGSGACSTVQKVQQINCNGLYKNEFMIIALAITILILAATALFTEKKNIAVSLKKGFVWYAICGLANGIVNLLVILLSLKMPASVMFPVISAGGIVTTALISVFVYKEKMSLQQKIGLVLGILAIIALNM